ncbi:MAG TPA: alpha-ketoglutarate-dependent dioxygenase AlkB [Usitatibacter sp.]|jgi:alkylated DNA repair dioxygenase AlkB|nr:alpha-ketoglutarate-dependent dioxygenase AlkB [Usitatibacter sp.]
MPAQASLFDEPSALPNGLVFQPDFIDAAEERRVLEGIGTTVLREAQYKQYTARRRVASFGAGFDYDANELTPAAEMAPFLLPLRERIAQWAGVDAEAFGYALIAEYRPGTPLGWHRDVPQFETVAGVSVGGAARMRFRPYPPTPRTPVFTLELPPRSAYILRDDVRWKWQHSIVATRELRYSITFRTRRGA